MDFMRIIIAISRPGTLVTTVLMYCLGTGIVDFLGHPIDWIAFSIGLVCSILLVLSSHFLDVFYRSIETNPDSSTSVLMKNVSSDISPNAFRRLILQVAITILTVGAMLTVLLIAQGLIGISTLLILGISFILSFIYAVPPFNLSQKGLGEIIETILIVNFLPAFGFLLQYGEIHRLLIMLTIPLSFLMIAMHLALALPRYGEDLIKNGSNMMTGLGWERGMTVHNLLIITGFGLIAVAYLFGLPWRLVWPGVLTLPLGVYQIWQMRQIALGVKPNWGILRLTSFALFGLTSYLITISLWIG